MNWFRQTDSVVSAKKSLINWSDTVTIPPTLVAFVAKDMFRENSAEIQFAGFDDKFQEYFLKYEGLIEESISEERTLRFGDLSKPASTSLITGDIGGEELSKINLADLYALLKRQPRGESGKLDNKGTQSIFVVMDMMGVFRAVDVRWLDYDGWAVLAGPRCFPWPRGSRVFAPLDSSNESW